MRIYVEDYLPGREASLFAALHVLRATAEQHAIWITEQMSKWHRQSLEVRDREMQLYETNKQLRELSPEELDEPETRAAIENQAAAERANGRRLAGLVASGEELVRQADAQPEIGVGHLEKWAEMLQILKDISGNRMPSVADLLKQASQAPAVAANAARNLRPMAGTFRGSRPGSDKPGDDKQATAKPPVPAVVDVESSQAAQAARRRRSSRRPSRRQSAARRCRPPRCSGGAKKPNEACPARQKVEEAVEKQQDLLAEFEKIADELNRVLANLEGSTLVKRLKAASRKQYKIAGESATRSGRRSACADFELSAGHHTVLDEMSERGKGKPEDVG